MALCAAHACRTWRQRVLVSLLSIVVLCLRDSEIDGFVRQLLIRPPAVIDKKETWRYISLTLCVSYLPACIAL